MQTYISQVKVIITGMEKQEDAIELAQKEINLSPASLLVMKDTEDESFVIFNEDHYDFLKKVEPETAEIFELIQRIEKKHPRDKSILDKGEEDELKDDLDDNSEDELGTNEPKNIPETTPDAPNQNKMSESVIHDDSVTLALQVLNNKWLNKNKRGRY